VDLLIVTHGVRGGPGIAAVHAARIARRGLFRLVAVGCLRGEPSLERALDDLPGPVVAVPLLLARGWIHDRVRARLTALGRGDLRMVPPVGTLPACADLFATVVREVRAGEDGFTHLWLVGHGTERHAESTVALRTQAVRLRYRFPDLAVETLWLEQPPRLAERAARFGKGRVLALGAFVDAGPHGRDDVAAALAPLGERARYTGPVGLRPEMADLIVAATRHRLAVPVS